MDQHRLPHRTPRAEGSPYRLRQGSDAAATVRRKELNLRASDRSPDMMTATTVLFSGKTNEKEMLHGLNDRFAGFIEKVRHLERQNHLLESEIAEMKERRARSPSLEEEYGAELEELRKLLRDIAQQKLQIELEHENLEEELAQLRAKYEKEASHRSDAESGIAMLKRDIGDAYQAKVQLDKKAQGLVDEMELLKKSHEAEVSRMLAQVEEAQQVNVGAAAARVDFGKADLTAALRDIRAQLEGHAASDLRQADETFRSQFAKLTEATESRREAMKASQREVQECRRHLQAKSVELDCNTGTRDALERQLREVEDRHGEDILHYQDTIKELENELISAKFDMSAHLREYQDLLNVKMELDVEILSYRKLLEGEETRLSTISGTPVSMPYIYRQSPVYTLPCLRPSPGRRAEPQYKFVEEIITETTREIEMSEFEESGSDEAVDGGAEEGCDKAERESSEEEEAEDNQSDRYGPDRDGEPASDSQQNLVESAERSEQGDDDKVEKETPVEGEGSEAVDKAMGESRDPEAAESTENDDRPEAENVHSEEAPGVPENEPCDSVANVNGQKASDVPMPPTVQKDVAAKAEDSKIEESEEVKKTESEVDKKVSALKKSEESDVRDDIDAAQAMVLKDESSAKGPTDSGDVQESSDVGKPQVEAPSLPAETTEKTTDLTVALSVPLAEDTVQPEKQNKETPSVVPRGEEKEDRITESMALGRADTVKSDIGHEVPKSVENTTDDADKAKDKSPSVKSEPPKLEVQKPNTGDKAQTVDTTFTKEKIAVTAEAKDAQQGAADGSKTQEPANAVDDTDLEKVKHTAAKSDKTEPPKLDGKKSISEDKTQTVEPIFPMEKIAVTVDSQPESSTTQEPSNAIDDKDVEKDKRTVAESDMTEPPKLEDTKPNTGDKTQTVDATIPKEKIAVTAETKGPQQGAPDSGKTLKPSNAKLEDEKSDSGDKTQTVEPIFPKEKIAVTEESKDSQQGVPDSSKTQPSNTDLEKVKSKAAESDMTEPPKPAGEKSISGDKTHEPTVPKEKIAITVENKDSHPDSRATQEPSNTDLEKVKHTAAESDMTEPPKLDGEKSISADKIPTVEPILPKEKIAVDNKDSKQDVTESSKEPSNADLEKVKRTAAKSDMTEPPKLDGEKSISADKIPTVQPILPKEKIAVTVDNKDSKQDVTESSKTQKPSGATDDSDLEKVKRTAAESEMTESPKLDSEKSGSGDKAPTVEPILPKEKITITVESKDSKQDVTESSKTQEPSNADLEKVKHTAAKSDMTESPKLEGEKSISVDKTQTVEPIFPKERIAVTVENKDSQPDSRTTQVPSNAIDDKDVEKVKGTAAEFDMTEPPKLDSEKSISTAPTVEPIVPKEKIAVTVESKDSQPDSRTTQEPSKADLEKVKRTAAESDVTEPPKLEGEKSVSVDKAPTVDPILPKEKIAVTVESKYAKQDVTESSTTQESSKADLEKVKSTAAKSDMTESPKLDNEKSVSVDKTPTVDPILPKEKITVTVESKESKQDVTESSKTQKPSGATADSDLEKVKHTAAKSDMTESPKLEGEKLISEDKTPTVEPIFPKEKIAVTVENKDAKQPDGSKSPEPPKVPEKINNAKEKEEKLKDSAKTKDSGKTTEKETEPIEICETKTPSQKEPGISTVSVTAKTVDGLMSEAAKPETENGFSNGIGGIKAEDNEPMKVVPQGEAGKEKTHTSI